jgi:2-C-methyl-D-erythritol 4-phosphate cytidylyltransferase
MIHDSQRALTQTAQFERVFQGLTGDIDAVRPISAFTETLKSVTNDQFVAGTIDRNSMTRTSTPELIRFSSIDFLASTSTWFVPLKVDAKIAAVLADANSTRINSENDLKLMQNLLNPN